MMKNFFALIKREFGLFFADSTLRSVFLLAPIIYALLFGFVYQKGKVEHLPILVVDLDNTPLSNQLIDMLGENEKLQVVSVRKENVGTSKAMRQLDAVVAVVIPERFEASVLQKRYPELNTYINTTNLLTANMASQGVQTTLGTFSAGINMQGLKKKGMSSEQAAMQYEPFKVNYIRLYNETGNYFTYMWPGVLAVVLQQVLLLGLAVSFAREYENKTLETEFLGRSGSAFSAILIKVLPFWILSVFILAIYYAFHHIFRAPIPSPLLNYAVTTGLFIMATSFLGVFISALLPSALKATQVLMLLATPAFIIGGYSWPLEAMPIGVQWLSSILPLTPFLNAHKVMLFQHGSLGDVLPSIIHMGVLVGVYGLLALITVWIKIYQMKKKIRLAQQTKDSA
jgi:ABC-2 type transport system permease protein